MVAVSEYEGTIRWFGVKWDSPMTDEAPEVPAPIGEECMYCTEAILPGESGVTMPYVGSLDEPLQRLPAHIECFVRSMIGSVAHQQGRCSCFRPIRITFAGCTEDDSDDRSYRAQAREAMSWLMEHRTTTT